MYNTFPYNSNVYNALWSPPATATKEAFQFDDYGLQNTNIVVSHADFSTAPTRQFDVNATPRANGELFNTAFWRRKVITLEGHITASSASDLEDLMDEMKKNLATQQGNLYITMPDSDIRVFIATLQNPQKLFANRKAYHVTFMPFRAEFLVLEPFGLDEDYSSEFVSGITGATKTATATNTGSAPAKLTTYINFTAASGVTDIVLTNNTTGVSMTLSSLSVTAPSVIKIDGENLTVTQDASVIDYSGRFIALEPEGNDIQIDVTSTSHSYELTHRWKNAYL